MRTLIFGSDGIAGSELMRAISDAWGTTRKKYSGSPRVLWDVDVTRVDDLLRAFDHAEPEVAINCTGVVKSECGSREPHEVVGVNTIAPHSIAKIAANRGCRVIHLSTDCVFDGTRGGRTEKDLPDATDLYGRTKLGGELLDYPHCVTLRTSFIGRDPVHKRGLLEWLLAQTHETIGYTQAMWSGLSMPELSRVIRLSVLSDTSLSGLYQVSGPVISKADLLETLIAAYGLPCRVRRVDEPRIDRTMDGSKFNQATGYTPLTWLSMAKELAATID